MLSERWALHGREALAVGARGLACAGDEEAVEDVGAREAHARGDDGHRQVGLDKIGARRLEALGIEPGLGRLAGRFDEVALEGAAAHARGLGHLGHRPGSR